MFYEVEIKDHVRVSPELFDKGEIKEIVLDNLNKRYEGHISQELGIIISVSSVEEVGEGIIIAGDGAAYYDSRFKLLSFKPEIQDLVLGNVTDITDFGVFFNIGAIDGMIHISQTMDDFVSFSKSGVLTGKESKRILKPNDRCKARIVAVSYKDMDNPKIGLTMRQPGLGNLAWIKEEKKKESKRK